MKWNYTIGDWYKYPNKNPKRYKLVEVRRFVAIFECGHRVTDCVFMDLINCRTGIQVFEDVQLKIPM